MYNILYIENGMGLIYRYVIDNIYCFLYFKINYLFFKLLQCIFIYWYVGKFCDSL